MLCVLLWQAKGYVAQPHASCAEFLGILRGKIPLSALLRYCLRMLFILVFCFTAHLLEKRGQIAFYCDHLLWLWVYCRSGPEVRGSGFY